MVAGPQHSRVGIGRALYPFFISTPFNQMWHYREGKLMDMFLKCSVKMSTRKGRFVNLKQIMT